MSDGSKTNRRNFLKALSGITAEETLMSGGLLGAAGFFTKQHYDANQYREPTINTPGFGAKGTKQILEKTAQGETQQINAYLLSEGQDTQYEQHHAKDFDWNQVTEYAEQYLSQIHPKIKPDISFENITPEKVSEATGKTKEEARGHLEAIKFPSTWPGYLSMDVKKFHQSLEPLNIEKADAEVYLSDYTNLATKGLALPSFGEAYLDTSGLETEQIAGWGIAHELGHLYGLDDNYMPLIGDGEGMMGADPQDHEVTSETRQDFDKVLQKLS